MGLGLGVGVPHVACRMPSPGSSYPACLLLELLRHTAQPSPLSLSSHAQLPVNPGSNNAPHMATSGSLASGGGSGGILYANGGGGGGGGVALGHPSNVVRITSGSSALRKAAAAGQGQAQGQGLGGGEAAGSPGAPGSPGLGGSGGAVGTVVATGIPGGWGHGRVGLVSGCVGGPVQGCGGSGAGQKGWAGGRWCIRGARVA